MASTKHTRRIHIDAAAEDVFYYVEDPAHFVAAMPADHHASVGAVNRSAEGVVTTYEILYRELGRNRTTVVTRGECVANERIVDRASAGPVHMLTLQPDATGTTLTYAWDAPKLLKMLDVLFGHSDKDAENALATFKREVEALR